MDITEGDPRIAAACAAAQERLARQFSSLDELRTRVGTLISATAVATGFLAGQSLNTAKGVPLSAWIGIIGAALVIVDCVVLLWPREWDGERLNALRMIQSAKEYPDQTIDEYHERNADFAARHAATNQPRLNRLYQLFAVGLVLLMIDFAGWIWTLATNH